MGRESCGDNVRSGFGWPGLSEGGWRRKNLNMTGRKRKERGRKEEGKRNGQGKGERN